MIPIFARHTFSKSDWDTDKILPQHNECWQPLCPSALGQFISPFSHSCSIPHLCLLLQCFLPASSLLPSPGVYPSSGYTALDAFQRVFRQRMGNEEGSAGSWEGSVTKGKESVSCQNSSKYGGILKQCKLFIFIQ